MKGAQTSSQQSRFAAFLSLSAGVWEKANGGESRSGRKAAPASAPGKSARKLLRFKICLVDCGRLAGTVLEIEKERLRRAGEPALPKVLPDGCG